MRVATLLLAASLASMSFGSRAATFCVSDSQQLRAALQSAGSNGANDVIRIKTGTYPTTVFLLSIAFSYSTAQDFDIRLEGGWAGTGDTCSRRVASPTATVLTGSGVSPVLVMTGANGSAGDMVVERLTIRDGKSDQYGTGLRIGGNLGPGGFAGDIVIERVYFDNNESNEWAAGLALETGGGARVRDSIFQRNTCVLNACAGELFMSHADAAQFRAVFANNTVFGNQCLPGGSSCATGGLLINGPLDLEPRTLLLNNIFALNDGNDVQIISEHVELRYNNINQLSGTPAAAVGTLNVINPGFISYLDEDFRLRPESPMRNAGYDGLLFGLPPYSTADFAGQTRVQEFRIDIGAHEFSERIFADGFD
jgi:hypothetical protein